jgi:hypothetical protein
MTSRLRVISTIFRNHFKFYMGYSAQNVRQSARACHHFVEQLRPFWYPGRTHLDSLEASGRLRSQHEY